MGFGKVCGVWVWGGLGVWAGLSCMGVFVCHVVFRSSAMTNDPEKLQYNTIHLQRRTIHMYGEVEIEI